MPAIRLTNHRMRSAVAATLERIRKGFPDDHAAILKAVQEFSPLPADTDDGQDLRTLGQVFRWPPHDAASRRLAECIWGITEPGPCRIGLLDEEPESEAVAVAVVAHELGHAMTLEEDLECGDCPRDVWASELAADRIATRWGFGIELAELRKGRDWAHHAVAPGKEMSDGDPVAGVWVFYRVTEDLRMEFVRTEPFSDKDRVDFGIEAPSLARTPT